MITIRKIKTLRPRVRVRKLGEVFHEASLSSVDGEYLKSALEALLEEELLSSQDRADILGFYSRGGRADYDDIYYRTLTILGESPADWDIRDENGDVDWKRRTVFGHYLYLDHLRSPYNVGSIFRSSEAFGVKGIFLSPGSASPLHERAVRTARGCVDAIAWDYREIGDVELPVFALETGGEDITAFRFPENGICIIGSEECGVSPEGLRAAENSLGRVSIRQFGVKGSINVASATAILLQYWANSEVLHG